ncbi:hypothetical protein [Candidatus Avelusimicrobium fimicolum]|uniref:hypothetical protein n=1 Tax=Candidatus Avelusimicrobium fimicolum TaxID=3416216 RepID=UPI003D0AF2E7
MNRIKSLIRVLSGRTVLRAVLALLLVAACSPLFAQRADVRSAGVYYQDGSQMNVDDDNNVTGDSAVYCNWGTSVIKAANNRSFTTKPYPSSNANKQDPWVSSALIEYDQPYPAPKEANNYPNHCLALCMQVVCTNRPMAQATYSIAFPLQNITFDIVKYYNGKNIKDAEGTPAIRSIDLYPDINKNTAKCGSYRCPGGPNDGYTCTAPLYEKRGGTCYNLGTNTPATDQCSDTLETDKGKNCANKNCNYIIFNNDGQPSGSEIPFCAAWDGSYDIAGEFGKSNGDFAFRATVATDFPGDNVAVDKIEFNSTIAYPGENQIPIQVDVTNVHTVRSTPTVVGDITAVPAQPYTFAYRLSKDADVRIAIFDASSDDSKSYGGTGDASTITGKNQIVRTLVDWQPRVGEGIKGVESDKQIVESDSWDGRSDSGMLLPAGNYIAAIQAKTQDEWPGIDFSRAVTRQVSLDPLKLTDIAVTGLNKKSTAYASISYVPTEASKVYWNIYTPGTTFAGTNSGTNTINTNSSQPTGTAPKLVDGTGTLVYSSAEDRTSRMNFTSKWDGLCGALDANGQPTSCTRTYAKNEKMSTGTTCPDATCTEQFAYGAPMPDGNYVYVLWAEIPYNGCYYNALGGTANTPRFAAGTACAASEANNNKQFTGVKTLSYYTGQVAIERGFVDITIQPVSYSTVGSSPTAYGLDPFIFKYSIVREANVVAKVTNSAGVDVKYLTPKTGITQVAQQMNTLSWDGRDDQGRMVTPGTYMFVVESKDAMFPAVTNKASAVFPVDMYRVVDVATTDVYGDSDAKATISYMLSKAMNVQINIYNKDVVIPAYNTKGGDYSDFIVNNSFWAAGYATDLTSVPVYESGKTTPFATLTNPSIGTNPPTLTGTANPYTRDTVTVVVNPNYVDGSTVTTELKYYVTLKREIGTLSTGVNSWPPRICNKTTDAAVFNAAGYVDPAQVAAKDTKCIYVNDTTFTNYPANAQAAASGVVDVRLQPIKTFDRTSTKTGDGIMITEEWDAVSFYNPTSTQQPGACKGKMNLKDCPYETVPDGQYPFFISARSNEPFDRYYAESGEKDADNKAYIPGAPFKTPAEVKQEDFWYATDKVSSKINITRGSVYFLDGSTTVYPNAPQLFNASTGPVFIPPYEIDFSVSRAATVEVAIVALKPNMCYDTTGKLTERNAAAGAVCKYLSTTTIANTGNFDPNTVRKVYWDGTDNNGVYVKPGIYEVRLIAKNYPDPHLYQETVKVIRINADLLKVFDLLEADGYALNQRDTDMKIGYQISVPMKVAIQIFKPGTTIYDYQKGTLRNPTTGTEVKDIHEVLVKAIVGIRPATTLIEEVWDGRDYAQQEVPDGTYPFRFVTALNSADIDSVTGEILGSDDTSADAAKWSIEKVADTYQYQNLHKATVAIGDGRFVCEDWEKTVFFYPNPLRVASKGTLEITKMPVPGTVSIKYFNLAGDLVRDSNYTCVDANNYQVTMGSSLQFNPDNTPEGSVKLDNDGLDAFPNIRNAALRCKWDRTNQHGKKVARGVYFGLVDFRAQNGREHCQKVVKILVP